MYAPLLQHMQKAPCLKHEQLCTEVIWVLHCFVGHSTYLARQARWNIFIERVARSFYFNGHEMDYILSQVGKGFANI